jgi:hypothetical protein
MIRVTEARPLNDDRLWVKFSDGFEGTVDLCALIEADPRPIVAALREPSAFAALRVDVDTVVWDTGFDLAPEFLREVANASVPA